MRCLITFSFLAAGLMMLAAPAAQAATCRVKTAGDGGSAGNSGASWAQAKTLTAALADSGCDEIWVKFGLYKPEPPPPPSDPRLTHFQINRPLRLYGSFAGTETAPEQRALLLHYRTILSADYNGDDPNQNGIDTEFDYTAMSENALHVLVIGGIAKYGNGSYTKTNTLVDGFVLTAGAASGGVSSSNDEYALTGAGLLCNGRASYSDPDKQCSPTLRNLWITGNWASDGAGIGFVCQDKGKCSPEIRNATLSNNFGGGIYMDCTSTEVCVPHIFTSTFADNIGNGGGGLKAVGNVSGLLLNTTFSGNKNGVNRNAIYIDGGNLQVLGTILWGGTGSYTSLLQYANGGYALVQYSVVEGGCPAGTPVCDDVRTDDPRLTFAYNTNGSYAPTISLLEGSSAIDHGDQLNCPPNNNNFPLDQRGQSRPFDGDGDGQALCDAGSVEVQNSPTFQVVDTPDDHLPPLNDGLCSLREAVVNATDNAVVWSDCGVAGRNWTDSILFDPNVFANASSGTVTLAGELPIHNNTSTPRPGVLVIDGTRGDGGRVTLQAGADARVISVDISYGLSTTRLYKLKISGGNPAGTSFGGGVYRGNGPLVLEDCVISGNQANKGGGVYVAAGTPGIGMALTMRGCTVSGNTATGDNGGGIMVRDSVLPVRIDASTISGNTAGLRGGGLMVDSSQVWLDRSTVSGNVLRADPWGRGIGVFAVQAPASGDTLTINHSTIANNDGNANTIGTGLYVGYGARATVNASVIAARSTDDGCVMSALGGGTSLTARYSLFERGMGCVSNDQGNNIVGTPYLYGLADNGGLTETQMPRWDDSLMIDAVPCNLTNDPDFDNSTDQRGIARPQDGNRDGDASLCDIGAVEVRGFAHQLTVTVPNYLGMVSDNYATHEIAGCGTASRTCQGTYAEGYDLVLTATPDTGSHFVEWFGNCSGTSPILSVPMLATKSCTARFALDDYTVTASAPGGHGSITPASQPVTRFHSVNFTVTPDAGYLVDNVSGDTCTPGDNGDGTWTAISIKDDCSVTASFVADTDLIFRDGFE